MQVLQACEGMGLKTYLSRVGQFSLLSFKESRLLVHLVSLDNENKPDDLIELQSAYRREEKLLVNLWEDLWYTKKEQVKGRIASLLGINLRVYARKANIAQIGQQEADAFLLANHVHGTAKSKYRIALEIEEKIVALACFSNLRYMKEKGPNYRSAELIRFASLTGYTVVGGFSRILNRFIARYRPNDIMSYADRDWSNGAVYVAAGFNLAEVTPPREILLEKTMMKRYFKHRISGENMLDHSNGLFAEVFNTGNLKYILSVPLNS